MRDVITLERSLAGSLDHSASLEAFFFRHCYARIFSHKPTFAIRILDDMPFPDEPVVESVLHPSDFSLASEYAFVHALAIALVRKTEFTILHTGESGQGRRQFPAVRTTLEHWGMLEPGSARSAMFEQLAVQVTKAAREHDVDLIAMTTASQQGILDALRGSVTRQLLREASCPLLAIPEQVPARGFPVYLHVVPRRGCPLITRTAALP